MVILTSINLWTSVLGASVCFFILFVLKELWRNKDNELKEIFKKDSKKNLNDLFGISKTAFLSTIASLIIISIAFLSFIGTSNQNKQTALINERTLQMLELKNRPNIDFDIAQLNQSVYLKVNDEIATFHIDFKNIGELPAKNINVEIFFLDNDDHVYEHMTIRMPESQKLFKGEVQTLKPSIVIKDTKNKEMLNAINSKLLKIGVEFSYRSDFNESENYITKKIFKIEENNVKLIGTLGNFQ